MFILNNQLFNVYDSQILNDVQYPAGWFLDAEQRSLHNILQAEEGVKPTVYGNQKAIISGFETVNGFPKAKWTIVERDQEEVAELEQKLNEHKLNKNQQINNWREQANLTSFPFDGNHVSCDSVSFKDISCMQGYISLFGEFNPGFPGAWKTIDNGYIPMPTIDKFKEMYAAMTNQGTANFNHSQTLKATLAAATTIEQVEAIVW